MTVAQALDILGRLETVSVESTSLVGWVPLCNPCPTRENAVFLAALALDARAVRRDVVATVSRGRTQLWESSDNPDFWKA